ncbi:MAG: triose-phosphate isomerase [Gemmatimonadetes bacterium]|nr:triose-phosphate isomerase [Gemmatimonadota bacterium]
MSGRRKVVAGNWKMNHGPAAAAEFFEGLGMPPSGPRVMIFPPAIALPAAVAAVGAHGGVDLGVQNLHEAESGAFTGEISAAMAIEAGAVAALVGHSERRHVFGESDARIAAKAVRAAGSGLEPVVCVGETRGERRAGRRQEVLHRQIDAALEVLAPGTAFLVAYEPVWAIGTGETATPADAAEAHAILRARLAAAHGESAAQVPILYGGSVKPGNAAELMAAQGVDGVLVGGASLKAADFRAIIEAALP